MRQPLCQLREASAVSRALDFRCALPVLRTMRARDSASARKPVPPGTSTVSNGTSLGASRLLV